MQGDDRPAPLNCLCLFHCKKHADTPRDLPSDQKVLPSRKGRSAATACPAALIRLQEYAILAEVMTFFSDLPTAGQRVAGRNGGRRFFRARLIESRQGRHKAELPEDNTKKNANIIVDGADKKAKTLATSRNVGMRNEALIRRSHAGGGLSGSAAPRLFDGAREEARDQSDLCSCRSAASFNRGRRSRSAAGARH